MVKINFVENDGNTITVDADPGLTLMQVGRDNLVPTIVGDCGGACACATCHVIVDDAWAEKLGKASESEEALLMFAEGLKDNSRLGCQITVTPELDGLVLHLPVI